MPAGATIESAEQDKGFPERVAAAIFATSGVQGQFVLYSQAVYTRLSIEVRVGLS